MADKSRDTLRGLIVADPRLRDESAIWTAESTGITQAGRRLSRPIAGQSTDWRIEARGDASENLYVQAQRGGLPGSGLAVAWKPASASDLRGTDPPVAIRGLDIVGFESGTGANQHAYPDSVTLEDGTIVTVCERAVSSPFAALQVYVYTTDPSTGTTTARGSMRTVISAAFGAARPFLFAVPKASGGERVMCGVWSEDSAAGLGVSAQIDLYYSDDSGVTWAIYAESVLTGTTTIDGVSNDVRDGINVAGSAGAGATGWDYSRCRAAYSNGQVLLMMHLVHHDTDYRRTADFLFQWSSADLGASFTLVDEATSLTATDDEVYRGGAPDVVARDGLFHVAYIDLTDAAYATGSPANTIGRTARVIRLGSSAQTFSAAGGDDSFAVAAGAGTVSQTGATNQYTLDDPSLAIVALSSGDMWLYWRLESTQDLHASFSDDGKTWTAWGASMRSAARGSVWDVDSGSSQPLDGSGASGITTDYPDHFTATESAGRVALDSIWALATVSTDRSLTRLYLGGHHTQTLGTTTSTAVARPTAAVGWEYNWVALTVPDNQRWTLSNSGTSSATLTASGMVVGTTTGTRYWTLTPAGSGAEGVILRFVMSCTTGSTSDDRCAVRVKVRTGTNDTDVSIRFSSTGLSVYDNHAASQLASETVTMTSAHEFELAMTADNTDGDLVLYRRSLTNAADNAWTEVCDVTPSVAADITAVHSIQWGHITSSSAASEWREFHFTSNDYTGLTARSQASANTGDDLMPLRLSSRWTTLSAGAYIRAVDGPAAASDNYTVPVAWDYAAARVLPTVNASPEAGWRSTDETQQSIALAYNPTTLGTENSDPMGDTIGVHLAGINWRTGTLEGYLSGSGWTSITAIDTTESYAYTRVGNVLELNALGFSRYVREGEWDGAWVDLGGGDRRRILHTRGGDITSAASGTTRYCRLILDGIDGSEASSGTASIAPKQATIIVRDATAYSGLRLTISAQSTVDGYFKIGALVAGPLLTFGTDYSWGRIIETEYGVSLSQGRGGQRRAYKDAEPRRVVEFAWTDGLDAEQVDSATGAADYMLSTSTSGIEPAAYTRATAYDLDGTMRLIGGPEHPIVYVPVVAKGTGGAGDVEILTDRAAAVYGRVASDFRLESILGDENTSEVWRVAQFLIEEEL